ncbi:hypothetical protein PHYSODRAFT_319586 [Phytophthora sojae]|uniref:BZIP domain-containing protein n=1 Tax=Phytophthora sojae (strain P6497) TaxID=1094619 RepID=G5AC75_PHYSP|nr:hypothetical protein PHYSODRAFT_319586 [Phytophthora sojae]EGZ06949.1 hypothetical protein PHYSODRAFT_319586 [Phytophthora sojae]|eukprot:XP_009537713.1 hypothetical protein PHYSODRAFT_319586 [Phytophthora sojae]
MSNSGLDIAFEAYHRERRRLNQKRYRKKQRKLAEQLEIDNQQLRNEIERLHNQRNGLSCGISTKETLWSVAVEYFRVFRRGLHVPTTRLSPGDRIVELEFLRATMSQDLDAGNVRGFELLTRNWKVFTQYFKDVHVQLRRLEQTSDRSLIATTTTSITITSHSLRYMLPNLAVADMIAPLLECLGSLEDVSLVFQNALIQPDCNLVIGEHLSQQCTSLEWWTTRTQLHPTT